MFDYTICITGHTGYIGSHFVEYLTRLGHVPFLVGRKGSKTEPVKGCINSQMWRDARELSIQLKDIEKPVFVNLAGLFVSNHKTSNFGELVKSNFAYPLLIFEAISELEAPKIINVGTSWEFSDRGVKRPFNLYAQLKGSNSDVCDWYTREFKFRTINLKLNDTFGGKDPRKKLMPYLKDCISRKIKPDLGFSKQKLDFLYIINVCDGLLFAVNRVMSFKAGTNETSFLFSGEALSLEELIVKINSKCDYILSPSYQGDYPKDKELRDVWVEAPTLTGWKPPISLDMGLSKYFGDID